MGQDVTLTIDVQMQFIVEEAVARAVRDFDARWGGALVVDVPSGEIMAWAQYPFFNPNTYKEASPLIYRNRLRRMLWNRAQPSNPLSWPRPCRSTRSPPIRSLTAKAANG